MTAATRRRASGLDALRVIALVAIVAGHTWYTSDVARKATYSWHVPLFFMLTGYLWHGRRTFAQEASARARTLLRPYLVWLLAVGAVYLVHSGRGSDLLADMALGGRELGGPLAAFWFVTALFAGALIYRLVPDAPAARLVLAGAALVLGTVAGSELSRIPEAVGVGFISVLFIAAGHALRSAGPPPLPVATVLLLAGGAAVATGAAEPLDLKTGDLGTPVLSAAVAVAIGAALIAFAEAAPLDGRAVGMAATQVASVGIVLVLTHALILYFVVERLPALVLALVLPVALGLVVARFPGAGWLIGRQPPARPTAVPALAEG